MQQHASQCYWIPGVLFHSLSFGPNLEFHWSFDPMAGTCGSGSQDPALTALVHFNRQRDAWMWTKTEYIIFILITVLITARTTRNDKQTVIILTASPFVLKRKLVWETPSVTNGKATAWPADTTANKLRLYFTIFSVKCFHFSIVVLAHYETLEEITEQV